MYNMKEPVGDLEIQTRLIRGVWITEYLRNGVAVETFAATTSPDRARKNHMYVVSRQKKLLNASV